MGVDEIILAPYGSRTWNISEESAEEVLELILWPEDEASRDLEAICDDADKMTLRELDNKHNLDVPERIILESEIK